MFKKWLVRILLNRSTSLWAAFINSGITLMEEVVYDVHSIELHRLANVCEAIVFVAHKEIERRELWEGPSRTTTSMAATSMTTTSTTTMTLPREALRGEAYCLLRGGRRKREV